MHLATEEEPRMEPPRWTLVQLVSSRVFVAAKALAAVVFASWSLNCKNYTGLKEAVLLLCL